MGCVSGAHTEVRQPCAERIARPSEAGQPSHLGPELSVPHADAREHMPTLLESNFLGRTAVHDIAEDVMSVSSSRFTNITAIPTPSNSASNLESLAISSNRPEFDKDSLRGASSIYAGSAHSESFSQRLSERQGTDRAHRSIHSGDLSGSASATRDPSLGIGHQEDCESFCGSIAESRMDSQIYLQEMEAGRIPEEVREEWLEDFTTSQGRWSAPIPPVAPPAVLRAPMR